MYKTIIRTLAMLLTGLTLFSTGITAGANAGGGFDGSNPGEGIDYPEV